MNKRLLKEQCQLSSLKTVVLNIMTKFKNLLYVKYVKKKKKKKGNSSEAYISAQA